MVIVLCMCVLSHVQRLTLCDSIALQAPLSMEFSRQEYWSGLPFPSPGVFPTQRWNLGLLHCRQIFTTSITWEAHARL